MGHAKTALVLIGYQNDYFAADGILRSVVEEGVRRGQVLENTISLLRSLQGTDVLRIATPILFTKEYSELTDPVGILKTIQDVGAFQAGTRGGETIPEVMTFGSEIVTVPGKRGLNAFSNTDLDQLLKAHGVTQVVLAGVVTAVCIDSTGRSAVDRGYRVTVLSDCTAGRSVLEQQFYLDSIFPLYARVMNHRAFLAELGR